MNSQTRRNRRAAPIAVVFIILCLIGVFTVMMKCISLTKDMLNQTEKKQEYAKMLMPVVMFDPVPFEKPEDYDTLSMLQACIWGTLLGDNRDKYEYDDDLSLIIPTSDVDVTANKLFGPDVKLSHQSFGDIDITYRYESAIKSYHVPVSVVVGFYTPRVEEITKYRDKLLLKVGYVPPSTVLNIDFGSETGVETEPAKYMIYEMRKLKNDYYLYAVRDAEGAGLILGENVQVPQSNPDELLGQVTDENQSVTGEPGVPTEILPSAGASSQQEAGGTAPESEAPPEGQPVPEGADEPPIEGPTEREG